MEETQGTAVSSTIQNPHTHVIMFSGGVGSWATAKRVAAKHGTENLYLLFTDTLIEDSDLYRFLIEGACSVFGLRADAGPVAPLLEYVKRIPEVHEDEQLRFDMLRKAAPWARDVIPGLVWLQEGRDPFQVFKDVRYLGNTRVDPCSKILKREMGDKWQKENLDPEHSTIYVGIDWTEIHRFVGRGDKLGLQQRKAEQGWRYEAPMMEKPLLTKPEMLQLMLAEGIEQPRLYTMGMAHNNCSGFCIKAGMGHFKHLLDVAPERYAYWERKEQELRDFLGRDDIAILRDRAGGKAKPLTLKAFRERQNNGGQCDMFDIGGCGCFIDD